MSWLKRWLSDARSDRDQKLKDLVANSYDSVRVVGRGTIRIDPREVSGSKEFSRAREQARAIVQAS